MLVRMCGQSKSSTFERQEASYVNVIIRLYCALCCWCNVRAFCVQQWHI